jgi:PAS domain S-box-containing protein
MAQTVDYRSLFESAPDLYLVLDPTLKIVAVSDAYLAATGTSRGEILGKNLFEVFPDNPQDATATGERNLRASLQTVLRTGRPHSMALQRYDIADPGGSGYQERYWSPVNSPVFKNGKLTHIIHRVDDVTDIIRLERQKLIDQEKAADALRSTAEETRSELYLRTQQLDEAKLRGFVASGELGLIPRANLYRLLMDAPAAVCIVRGAAHAVELANPVFRQLAANRDILGRPLHEALPDGAALLEPLGELLETGETVVGKELALRVDRGQGLEDGVFNFVYQRLVGVEGKEEGIVLFGFDVTEQVRAREAVEALAEHLREADKHKDEFIAIISHELRTPMTSILGWTRMLTLGGLDEQTYRDALDALERSTLAQAKLIEDLLDESRIAAGKLRLDLRALDLGELLAEAVRMARPSAEAKQITLSFDAAPDCCASFGDPGRLQQVIGNLLGNAIKFTPEGGTVTVRIRPAKSFAIIEVTDSGEGIDPALLPHVFDRFRQGDAQGERKSGLGLGLAIVRHLVEMHGGSVAAASQGKGTGATFTIRLPLHEAIENLEYNGRDSANRVAALPRLSGIRVLIVEDDVDNRKVIALALERSGATVQCSSTAAAADEKVDSWRPDILVCDIALPDRDGCSFLEAVRERGLSMPALALTVLGRPNERERILAAGFERLRQKPIDPIDLAHEIARLTRREQNGSSE